MLGQDETLDLIKKAQSGDEYAKEVLINENSPLIKSVIRWFKDKGIENDDLFFSYRKNKDNGRNITIIKRKATMTK